MTARRHPVPAGWNETATPSLPPLRHNSIKRIPLNAPRLENNGRERKREKKSFLTSRNDGRIDFGFNDRKLFILVVRSFSHFLFLNGSPFPVNGERERERFSMTLVIVIIDSLIFRVSRNLKACLRMYFVLFVRENYIILFLPSFREREWKGYRL